MTEYLRDRDFPGTTADFDALLRHVVSVGSRWFGVALLALLLPLAGLFAGGWRPSDLAAPAAPLWWVAELVAVAGVGCLAWAGCPVILPDAAVDARSRSRCIRIGVVLLIAGTVVSSLAVLVG